MHAASQFQIPENGHMLNICNFFFLLKSMSFSKSLVNHILWFIFYQNKTQRLQLTRTKSFFSLCIKWNPNVSPNFRFNLSKWFLICKAKININLTLLVFRLHDKQGRSVENWTNSLPHKLVYICLRASRLWDHQNAMWVGYSSKKINSSFIWVALAQFIA